MSWITHEGLHTGIGETIALTSIPVCVPELAGESERNTISLLCKSWYIEIKYTKRFKTAS